MGVCGNICCVSGVVKDSDFTLGVVKYGVCLCRGCDRCCVFCLNCEAWNNRYSSMGNMSVTSCIWLVCILWQFSMMRSAWLAVC